MGTVCSVCSGGEAEPEFVKGKIVQKQSQSQSLTDQLVYHIFGEKNIPLAFGFTTETVVQALLVNVEGNYEYVMQKAKRGDVTSVLNTMDEYGYSHFPMISIGDVKGAFVDSQVEQLKPKVVVELGTHTGYGAMRFARKMKEVMGPSAHVYTFEVWEPFADKAQKLFDFAGISDMITLIHGSFADKVDELKKYGVEYADIVLIDHNKELYLSDLHVIEKKRLLKKGSVVLADNVIEMHRDDYRTYVAASRCFDTRLEESVLEYKNDHPDGIEVSTYLGPLPPEEQKKSDELVYHIFGDPNIPLDYGHTTATCCDALTNNVPANYEYVQQKAKRGDVTSVLNAMDEFGYSHFPMISIGDVKGAFMDAQVAKYKPKVVVELGTFTGYGAMRFARKMREVVGPSAHVYTFEVWAPFAEYATKVIEYAGMSDMITVITGSFADKVGELKKLGVDHTDVLLIDHNKELYVSDLHVAEKSGLLKKGSVVFADNVIYMHRDEYREYVRSSPMYETHLEDSVLEYKNDAKDGIEVSTYLGA